MRWFGLRSWPVVSTLTDSSIVVATPKYRGTQPLEGEWDIVRVVLLPDGSSGQNVWFGWGVRLATNVPGSEDDWGAAERLWYGDTATGYLGDGFLVPGSAGVVVEGPFRIRPRGRRLVVRFSHNQSGSRAMAVTFVLQRV